MLLGKSNNKNNYYKDIHLYASHFNCPLYFSTENCDYGI